MTVAAAGASGGHAIHLLVLGVPSAAVFMWLAAASVRRRLKRLRPVPALHARAAAASLAAAAVHGLVCPEHFREAFVYGLFFLTAAVAQLAWAVLVVVRPGRALLLCGALGNLAMIGLWAFTRVVAVPVGPGSGSTEAVGLPDLLATALELAVVVAALAAWRRLAVARGPVSVAAEIPRPRSGERGQPERDAHPIGRRPLSGDVVDEVHRPGRGLTGRK